MSTIRASLVALSLLAICLSSANTTAASLECCRSYTRGKIPCNAIKGYSVQTATEYCNHNAIIFHTKRGKLACTHPALNWVMQCVERLRNKAQMVHKNSFKA